MPTISVIVPVYNAEKYLDECVDSILNQTFKDFELILVDDGSQDNSPQICDNYVKKDKRVTVIHKKSNNGVSSARNAGLDVAGGGFISFVDSDDYIEKDFLLKLYHGICGCDICSCDYYFSGNSYIAQENSAIQYFTPYEYFKLRDIFVWNKLFSKRIFDNIRFKEGIIFEDSYIFTHVVFASSKISVISEKLYCYRVREGSQSRTHWNTNLHKYCKLLGDYDTFCFLRTNNIDLWKQYYFYSIGFIKDLGVNYSSDVNDIFIKLRKYFFRNICSVFSINRFLFFCFPKLYLFFKGKMTRDIEK